MSALLIAMAFGALQVVLLWVFTASILSGAKSRAILIFIVKVLLYGAGVYMLVSLYFAYIKMCAVGFVIGMPVFALVLFLIRSAVKKQK